MDFARKYTVDEVAAMREHAQLIGGMLVIQDYTTQSHNDAVYVLESAFRDHIRKNGGDCTVSRENVALWCRDIHADCSHEFYMPDLMVTCDRSGVKDDGIHVAPDFVAEVVSEGSREDDYNRKLLVYRKLGVKEYWIFDIEKGLAIQHLLREDYISHYYFNPAEIAIGIYDNELVIDTSEIYGSI